MCGSLLYQSWLWVTFSKPNPTQNFWTQPNPTQPNPQKSSPDPTQLIIDRQLYNVLRNLFPDVCLSCGIWLQYELVISSCYNNNIILHTKCHSFRSLPTMISKISMSRTYPIFSLLTLHSTSQLSMKVIIQLQYSLTDSRVFRDVKNITQSSFHPTQPNPLKIKKLWPNPTPTQSNPTRWWTQPMTNSVLYIVYCNPVANKRKHYNGHWAHLQ